MSQHSNETALAIILSQDGRLPDNAALARSIRARIPSAQMAPSDANGGSLLFFAEGLMMTVGKMSAPAPIAQNDACVASAWYWPDAWREIKQHKAHMVASATGGDDARKRANVLGQLVAAIVEATPKAGAVHWASSDAVWPASLVAKTMAPGDKKPPIMFCVSAKLSRDADGKVSAVTRGLADFGLMEIETRGFEGDPRALNGAILDLAGYLVEAGDVLKDGDTIGPDAATKITVRHEESSFLPGQKVYRLYFQEKGGA